MSDDFKRVKERKTVRWGQGMLQMPGKEAQALFARIEKQDALFRELVDVLEDVRGYYDESREDCGICEKGMFAGHSKGCFIPDVEAVLRRAQAAMKGEAK